MPFPTDYDYKSLQDTTNNYKIMISNLITDDIEDLLERKILQKTTFKLKWYSFGIPHNSELKFMENQIFFDFSILNILSK